MCEGILLIPLPHFEFMYFLKSSLMFAFLGGLKLLPVPNVSEFLGEDLVINAICFDIFRGSSDFFIFRGLLADDDWNVGAPYY